MNAVHYISSFPPILQNNHTPYTLPLTWHLLHLAVFEHVAAVDRLELQVASHLAVQQDLHQLAARHDEFGNQVHVPVCVVQLQ